MKSALLIILFFTGISASAQPALDSFNVKQRHIAKTSMYVLGSWAVANIISGSIGAASSSGSQKSFYQMNLGWGVVNGILAGTALIRFHNISVTGLTLAASLKEQHKLEKIFAFNTGLDVGYIAAGAWMLEKGISNTAKANQWKGFGQSLLLQGGFLFVFDALNLLVLTRHGKLLNKRIENLQFSAGGTGIGLTYKL